MATPITVVVIRNQYGRKGIPSVHAARRKLEFGRHFTLFIVCSLEDAMANSLYT